MFSKHDISRNAFMLTKGFAKCGYDWWWHSFTGINDQTGEAQPFFIEFFICNPDLGGEFPIFGQLPENKAKNIRPSYLMIKVGTWGNNKKQIHNFYGWNEVTIDKNVPFFIKCKNAFLTENLTYGSVQLTSEEAIQHPEYMSDAGTFSWHLQIDKKIPFNVGYGASKPMRALQIFEMFWHAEGMKTEYTGSIELDGTKFTISPKDCYGYADKNWGKNFTSPWVWLSSNNLKSKITGKQLENSVFDIGGGRPKIGFIALKRQLLSAFYYEGTCYEFNFSKFWTGTRTIFDCKETDTEIVWHIEQRTWNTQMITDIACKKVDMLWVNYEAPTGEKRHNRLWNGGNGYGTIKLYKNHHLIDEIEVKNVGCEYGEFD